MNGFKEYDHFDGLGLAELIKKKEVSAEELLNEAIQRIERTNPYINAVIIRMYDLAREEITRGLPEGPFKGVPFLLKDLRTAYAGVVLTNGCKAMRNFVPDYDSELVSRFKRAGVLILGKTNTPEFGLLGVTEPELHGPTRNPWNPDFTPGGSSGGSAAAVAAEMVPMAAGGDGGGSIRIPSSYCGLFGLKPTRGRNPTGPINGEIWQGAVVENVITRSVRDCAAMLDFTCSLDFGAPYVTPLPERPYREEIKRDPGRLRIAFSTRNPIGFEIDPEHVLATQNTAKLLEKLGHYVEEAIPDIDGAVLLESYLMMYYGEVAAEITDLCKLLKKEIQHSDVEPGTWMLNLLGQAYSAGAFVTAKRRWANFSRSMAKFHKTYELYLTPTTALPPARIGELQPRFLQQMALKLVNVLNLGRLVKKSGLLNKVAFAIFSRTPFTQLANLTGQPAMSVPLHWTSNGLPCGMQFIAPFGDEATLFRLAAQFEKEKPWFDKRPELIEPINIVDC